MANTTIPLQAMGIQPYTAYETGATMAANRRLAEAQAATEAETAKDAQIARVRNIAYDIVNDPNPQSQAAKMARFNQVGPRMFPEFAGSGDATLEELRGLIAMGTSPEDALKQGKLTAEIGSEYALGDYRRRQTQDIGEDNIRDDRVAGAQIGNYNASAASSYASAANSYDTIRSRQGQDQAGAYGQLPDGYTMQGNVAAPIPGYVPPPSKAGGNVTVDPVTGALTVAPPGKLTEAQGKDIYYLNRMRAVADQLDASEGALTSYGSSMAAGIPIVGNAMKGKDYQLAEQLGREFLASVLRKETGAAITAEEWRYYGPLYLAQPGDDPATIARKREARRVAMQGVEAGLGNAAGAMPQGMPGVPQGGPQPGMVEDGYRFKGGNPADPNSWEPAS